MASAGPYAHHFHLAPDICPCQYLTTRVLQVGCPERQAWCYLQVKICDPCLSALYVPWCEKALYKYSSFPFLSFLPPVQERQSTEGRKKIVANWLTQIHVENHTTTTTTVLRPFFWDHPREPVPEKNFWTLWRKGRLTEADTLGRMEC